MGYTRYKTFWNRKNAYEVTSYWDCKQKKTRQKVRYIDIVDKQGNVIEKKIFQHKKRLILDFGDTYLLPKSSDKYLFYHKRQAGVAERPFISDTLKPPSHCLNAPLVSPFTFSK